MNKLVNYIILWGLAILPVLLASVNVLAQGGGKAVPRFEVTQCDTLQFEVTEMPGDEYTWDLYEDSTGNFAVNQGDMASAVYFENGDYRDVSRVRVIGLPTGSYFLRVMAWDEVACTNNLMIFRMDVIPPPPPEVFGDSLCIGDVPMVRVIFSGTGPWTFDYGYSDGVNTVNINGEYSEERDILIPVLDPLGVGESSFWIMEVTDACDVISYEVDERPRTGIVIYPKPNQSRIYLKDDD